MGRDSWRSRQHDIEREQRKQIHPIWRGVGCLMMSGLAIGGYLFSNWLLIANTQNGWVYLPPEVIAPSPAALPGWLRGIAAPLFGPGVLVSLIVAFLFFVFSLLIVNIAYSVAFPVKPGETDVPPLKRRRRKT